MPTPGNFPDSWEDKSEKDENDEIEKGQEGESWTKEAWNVFKNKLDEYSSGRVGTGIKMYAGDTVDFVKTSAKETVDFVKSKVEALSKSDRLTFFNGLAREGTFIVAAKNDLMEKVSENFSYNFKNEQLRKFFQNSSEIFKGEKEQNYADLEKLENGEMKDLGRIKGVGTGAGTLIKYGKLAIGSATAMGGALMGTMAIGHYAEVAKKTRLQAESVIEKTRIGQLDEKGELIDKDDLDRAWDEAYRLYNEALARSEDGDVSARDLDKIYQENLPKDILDRIERNENFDGLGLLQRGMITIMKNNAQEIEAEFLQIENSDKTVEEKALEMQAIIRRNEKLLEELDGMVSDQGTIDTYAALAKISEKTGKMATLLVTLGITAEGVHKAWDSLKEVNFSRFSETVAGLRNRFMNWTGTELNAADGKSAADYKSIMEHIKVRNPGKLITDYSKEDLEAFIEARNGLKALDPKSPEVLVDVKNQKFGPDINASKNSTNDKFNESINKYDPRFANAKTGTGVSHIDENVVKVPGQIEKSTAHHFTVDETIKTKHGGSIWSQIRHNLEKDREFKKLSKELQIKNINLVKNHILNDPNSFLSKEELAKLSKLEKDFDPKKMLAKEIDDVKLQKAFDETINKNVLETRGSRHGVHHREHHGGGKGHIKPLSGIDAPPRAIVESVSDDLATPETHKYNFVPEENIKEGDFRLDNKVTIPENSQLADEWKIWENRSADDFLHAKYGEAIDSHPAPIDTTKGPHEVEIIFKRPDALEITHRELLHERLENAHDLIGEPAKGEAVGQYITRYNLENANKNGELFSHLKHAGIIRGGASAESQVFNTIDKLPSEMKNQILANFDANKNVVLGYVKLFNGDRAGVSEGIKKFFDFQGPINPESIKIKPDGSILYENAFGKNNYDLQISKDKVGVDGPLFHNMKKTGLSLESIKNAKSFIIEGPVSKTVAEATMDMGKEGAVVSGEGAEVIKPEVKMSAGSEKVGAVVEKNIGSGKGKMLDISTESVVERGGTGRGKMIDLAESSHEEKFNQATAEKIKTIDTTVSGADKKNFDALVSKFNKYSDNDLVKAIESAKSEEEKKLIAKAIAKVMEQRNLEDEKNF